MFEATILADSVADHGVRLTTFMVRFPRIILAEVNTHRVFSRNYESSRAVPTAKKIAQVRDNPFVPLKITASRKGMSGAPMDEQSAREAEETWLAASLDACRHAERMMELGVHKQHANRVLEPFVWISGVITATEWENFFALRCPPGDEIDFDYPAQPEFQQLAILMRDEMAGMGPLSVPAGAWHTPGVTGGRSRLEKRAWTSAGRMARVSYDNVWKDEDEESGLERARKLAGLGHLSPMEHPARPLEDADYGTLYHGQLKQRAFVGNLRGWVSLRKTIPDEDNYGKILGSRDAVQ